MKKKWVIWIIGILLTLATAYYQRITGPTYPIKGSINIENEKIDYKLLRSANTDKDARIEIISNTVKQGKFRFKRYQSTDEWSEFDLINQDNKLIAIIPVQPAAGKLVYEMELVHQNITIPLHKEPVVIRFKGNVPAWALIPHIILIFLAMLFSNISGLFAIYKVSSVKRWTIITVIFMFLGGMIMGPIVQKFAFGAFWTGIPFGWDLTDNKTLIAMVVWLMALNANIRKTSYKWIIIATIVTLLVFLIPHSMFGSQLDYSTGIVKQG